MYRSNFSQIVDKTVLLKKALILLLVCLIFSKVSYNSKGLEDLKRYILRFKYKCWEQQSLSLISIKKKERKMKKKHFEALIFFTLLIHIS